MNGAAIPTDRSTGRNGIFFLLIAVLSVAGVIVSAVALQRHYAKSATEFCDLGQKFNCDIVNRSEQSTIVGIPVAGIGVAGYGVLFWLATFARSHADTPLRLLIVAAVGLLFALRLTYVEAYVLETWCILCVTSQILILLITLLAIPIKLRSAEA